VSLAVLQPELVVSKDAEPDVVQAGERLTYTIRITNTGELDLHATVIDNLPSQVEPSGELTWYPMIPSPGGVWSQQVVVTAALSYEGPLVNRVYVTTDEGASGFYEATSWAGVTPELMVSKRASPDPVQSGERLTYYIVVTNTGNTDLHATVTDYLPPQFALGGTRTWNPIVRADGGVWEQSVSGNVELGYTGPLTNVVRVTTDEGPSAEYTETSWAVGTPELTLTQYSTPDPVQAGERITYSIRVINNGNVDLHATVTDYLPDQLIPGGTRTWNPTIPTPNGMWEQTVSGIVKMGYSGPLTNLVEVTTDEGAYGESIETAEARVTPKLLLSKSAYPDPVQAGEELVYTIVVTNIGNIDLHATVTDQFPAQFTPGDPGPWYPTIPADGGVWQKQVPGIVAMSYSGRLRNLVEVTSDEGAAGAYLTTSWAEVTPSLEVTKQANPDPVEAGGQLVYTIIVTNLGNTDLHATVTDYLPDQVRPGGTRQWRPTIAAAGGVWSQDIIVTVEEGYSGPLTNLVQVTTAEGASGEYTEVSWVY
jgi:uncharacterized repeat protein (TIGR01451 family)